MRKDCLKMLKFIRVNVCDDHRSTSTNSISSVWVEANDIGICLNDTYNHKQFTASTKQVNLPATNLNHVQKY